VSERLTAALAGRYRIERELGAGGMATVYLAEDLKHDRKVAIKVLKPELAAVLGAERFVVEIKTTAAMSHPHILPLLDSGTADGFLFYVMPYIEGETTTDTRVAKRLPTCPRRRFHATSPGMGSGSFLRAESEAPPSRRTSWCSCRTSRKNCRRR
jgi:serine/threonine protein kinase